MEFKEKARELKTAVVANQGSQETRWCHAELRIWLAWLRNAYTIYKIMEEKSTQASKDNDNTLAAQLLATMKKYRDPNLWLKALVFTIILDMTTKLSLKGQSSSSFATTVMLEVELFEHELADSGKTFI